MRHIHTQRAIVTGAAGVLLCLGSLAPGQEKALILGELGYGFGKVELPKGRTCLIHFYVAERKDNAFRGKVVYDLGLRQQDFEVNGTIDPKGRVTFTEEGGYSIETVLEALAEGKQPQVNIHPHSPVWGGGTFEGTVTRKMLKGVAHLYLVGQKTRERVACNFELELLVPLKPIPGP